MTTAAKAWNIIDLIGWGTGHFTEKGIENARREMEWLLCNVLGCERIDLYLKFENLLKVSELKKLRTMVKRRASGEPFQHIIGKAPFYGRDFIVNSNVLIPRAETGVLIDRLKENKKVSTLLDVGTGSGCIAITCALEKLSEKIYATDISPDALEIARENIQLHKTESIQAACHDFLNKGFKSRFDVVISNPPYIAVDKMDSLQAEVRDYDPERALTDGADGYVFYRRFSKRFDDLISPGGYMLLEIGGNSHKEGVEKIFSKVRLQTTFLKDLQGDFRAVEVRK
jgi:release factor glutamine methyltransferase